MKTKLLKRIRRRFQIDYYPNRKSKQFVITDEDSGAYTSYFWICDVKEAHETKQSAIDDILTILRFQYRKYTRKAKIKLIKKKVWYSQ